MSADCKELKARGEDAAGAFFEAVRAGALNTKDDTKNINNSQHFALYRVHQNLLVTVVHRRSEVGHE